MTKLNEVGRLWLEPAVGARGLNIHHAENIRTELKRRGITLSTLVERLDNGLLNDMDQLTCLQEAIAKAHHAANNRREDENRPRSAPEDPEDTISVDVIHGDIFKTLRQVFKPIN